MISSGYTPVDWDGGLSERQYKIIFKNSNGEFVSGVKPHCYGNKVFASAEIAKEINNSSNISDLIGEIKFSHSRFFWWTLLAFRIQLSLGIIKLQWFFASSNISKK